jgi:hypothetical protein
VGTYHVAVLYCGNGGGVWGAMLNDCSAHDLASLRRALENHHFKAIVTASLSRCMFVTSICEVYNSADGRCTLVVRGRSAK